MKVTRTMLCCVPIRQGAAPPPIPQPAVESPVVSNMRTDGSQFHHQWKGKLGRSASEVLRWRPSLCTITEDDVILVFVGKPDKKIKPEQRKMVRSCSSKSNVNHFYAIH
ncbi:hypothetical protein Ancab_033677 [Ancistrocladus abbreviatus]